MQHGFIIKGAPRDIPSKHLPDGAVTGNGDLTVTWAGTPDRVRLYIGKSDFWNADDCAYSAFPGGIAPLGFTEIRMPEFFSSAFLVEQDVDRAVLTGRFTAGEYDAALTVRVASGQNTLLIALDHTFPGL